MTTPRFIQIHTLHSYPAALLNRDDSGLAKRMTFGGTVRTRISSQCLKRHWRDPKDEKRHEYALHRIPNSEVAIRSRNVVGRRVIQPLREAGSVNEDVLKAVEDALYVGVYAGSSPSAEARRRALTEEGRQPLLLGLPEVEYLSKKAVAICETHPSDAKAAGEEATKLFGASEERNNFRAFRESAILPAGLEGALFGRMVTSDPGANIEAAIHVAHAFTVHREESESDYFTAVDDLTDDEETGAGFISDTELTAGLFYGYVVVDVPGLVSNLEGCEASDWQDADRELAAKVIEHLAHLIATVSPGAKLGSTAPYACADLMLVETGRRQPRSLANAYRTACKPQVEEAATALAKYLGKLDDAYGLRETRRVMSVEDCEIPSAERLNLDDLASYLADTIRNGSTE